VRGPAYLPVKRERKERNKKSHKNKKRKKRISKVNIYKKGTREGKRGEWIPFYIDQ